MVSPALRYSPDDPALGGPIYDHLIGVVSASDGMWLAQCYFESWHGPVRHTVDAAVVDAETHESGPLGEPSTWSPYRPQRPPDGAHGRA